MSLYEALCALLIYYLVASITQPGSALSFPVVGNLHQRFPEVADRTLFICVALAIGATFVIRAVLVVTQAYLLNRLIFSTGVSLSRRLFHIYLSQSYAWHMRHNSSELIRNAYESVGNIVTYFFLPIVVASVNVMVVAAVAVVVFVKAPIVTLAAISVLAALGASTLRVLRPRYAEGGAVNQQAAQQAILGLQQSLAGIRDVKLLNRSGFFEKEFVAARTQQARANYTRATLVEVTKPTIETVTVILILIFLAVSRNGGGESTETLADLGLFAYAILRVMPLLNHLMSQLGLIQFGKAAADQVLADLGLAIAQSSETVEPLRFRENIVVSDVSFRYSAQGSNVLSNVSVTIQRGESIGIVGSTGAGKSTLLDLLLGLLEPISGSIMIDDADMRTVSQRWHAIVGVVSQTHFLVDDSLRKNVALGVPEHDMDEQALMDAVNIAQLDSFIAALPEGLDTVVGERGIRLSGGQRQRVSIARAMYRRPQVLVLDEGTAALDNATELDFTRAIESLRGRITIITVAHRLSTVRDCSRIVLLEGGRVVDIGTYDELIDRSEQFQRIAGAS